MGTTGNLSQSELCAGQEFLQQLVILLGGSFFEAAVGFVKFAAQFGWHIRFRGGPEVEDLAEARFLPERHFKRDAVLAKDLTDLFDGLEEIAVFLVELADKNQPRLLHQVEEFPDAPGTDLNTGDAIDHHDRRIGGSNGSHGVAVKIGKAGCVEQADLVVLPLAMEGLGVNGALPGKFVRQIVDIAGSTAGAAMFFHGLGDKQNRIEQRSLAAGRMANHGQRPNLRDIHRHTVFSLVIA